MTRTLSSPVVMACLGTLVAGDLCLLAAGSKPGARSAAGEWARGLVRREHGWVCGLPPTRVYVLHNEGGRFVSQGAGERTRAEEVASYEADPGAGLYTVLTTGWSSERGFWALTRRSVNRQFRTTGPDRGEVSGPEREAMIDWYVAYARGRGWELEERPRTVLEERTIWTGVWHDAVAGVAGALLVASLGLNVGRVARGWGARGARAG